MTTGRIVVGVDGSPSASVALRWAIREAELTGRTVQAVFAWQCPMTAGSFGWAPVAMDTSTDWESWAEKSLAEAVNAVTGPESAVEVEQRTIQGYAPNVLLGASAGADLLVVGSRGHGAFTEALLGSVSLHCAHHARCPVVIVHGRPG